MDIIYFRIGLAGSLKINRIIYSLKNILIAINVAG